MPYIFNGTDWVATLSGSGAADGDTIVFNVKDAPYSAVGNGTTDDKASIQAAIDAAFTAGGGEVLLPPGNYKITNKITMKSGVTLVGQGSLSVLKPAYASTNTTNRTIDNDWLTGSSNITLRDFKIDRSGANVTHGIIFNGVDGLLIDGVEVVGTPTISSGCIAISGIGPAVRLLSKNIRIVNCSLRNTSNYGIQVSYVDVCVIANNVAHDSYREVYGVEPEVDCVASNVVISGNSASGSTPMGPESPTGMICVSEASGGTINGVTVVGNVLSQPVAGSTTNTGIRIDKGQAITVVGNSVHGMDGAGITVGNAVLPTVGLMISGNTIVDCSRSGGYPGINIRNSSQCTVVGNYVYGTSHTYGIEEQIGSANNLIASNFLRDTSPIGVPGTGTQMFGNKTNAGIVDVTLGSNVANASQILALNAASGVSRNIKFKTAGVDRWHVVCSGSESGGSATGSELFFNARDDSGNAVGTAISLTRNGRRLITGGSYVQHRRAVAANTTVTAFDYLIGVTDTSAARTITLTAASTDDEGRTLVFKDESGGAGTNNITIARNGSDLIDGATSVVIASNYGAVTLYCTGTGWAIL